jgi:hypothetical protein
MNRRKKCNENFSDLRKFSRMDNLIATHTALRLHLSDPGNSSLAVQDHGLESTHRLFHMSLIPWSLRQNDKVWQPSELAIMAGS